MQPAHFWGAALVIAILGNAFCLLWLAQQPYLGASFKESPNDRGVMITRIEANGPADKAGFKTGEIIVSVRSDQGGAEPIHPIAGIIEPDFLKTGDQFNALMRENGRVHRHLGHPGLSLLSEDGIWRALAVTQHRPISSILRSQEFLGSAFVATLSLLLGFALTAQRRGSIAARLILLSSISWAIVMWTAALYWTRELALSEMTFRTIMATNHLGATIFPSAIAAILWVYPIKIANFSWLALIASLTLLLWLNKVFTWIDLPLHNHMFGSITQSLLGLAGGVLQWRRTRMLPIERAQLFWLLLSIYACVFTVIVLFILPIVFAEEQIGELKWIPGLIAVLPLLGFALGISRYRLFDLPKWWFETSLWMVGGLVVIFLEIALVFFIGFEVLPSLALATIVAGWLYFPLRQWVYRKVLSVRTFDMATHLPTFVTSLSSLDRGEEIDLHLSSQLKFLLNPFIIEMEPGTLNRVTVHDEGLVLCVPSTTPNRVIRLEAADNSRRLFGPDDIAMATTLTEIAQRHRTQIEALKDSVATERTRIARDLHDDVAGNLVSLIHRSEDPTALLRAREALASLKDTIWMLRGDEDVLVEDALAKWCEEAISRTEDAGIKVIWHQEDFSSQIAPRERLVSIGSILRELITNAIRHNGRGEIAIFWTAPYEQATSFKLRLVQSKPDRSLSDWLPGLGLNGIEERVSDLKGNSNWHEPPSGRSLEFVLEAKWTCG